MKPSKSLSIQAKWAIVLLMTLLHPLLLMGLHPYVGERANLVVVLAPFAAAWFFSWRLSIACAAVNTIVTGVMFTYLASQGPKDGLPKSIAAVLIVCALSFCVESLRRFIEKGKAMEAELDRIHNSSSDDKLGL